MTIPFQKTQRGAASCGLFVKRVSVIRGSHTSLDVLRVRICKRDWEIFLVADEGGPEKLGRLLTKGSTRLDLVLVEGVGTDRQDE